MKKAMKIKVINRSAYALPQYETAGAAGMDVRQEVIQVQRYTPDADGQYRAEEPA